MIFGHKVSYQDALQRTGLQTLRDRRADALGKFAKKAAENKKYTEWFKIAPTPNYELRREARYEKKFAHTDRLYKSPLFAMRRFLNNS